MMEKRYSVHEGIDYIQVNDDITSDHRKYATVGTREFAERIVACLNACEGIPDDILKRHCTKGYMTVTAGLLKRFNQSEKMKEELLGALKTIVKVNFKSIMRKVASEAVHSAEKGKQ